MAKKPHDEILAAVAADRREFVARLLRASTFAVPIALGAATIAAREAQAQATSQSAPQTSAASSASMAIPEPTTLSLIGLGAASAALAARRKLARGDNSD